VDLGSREVDPAVVGGLLSMRKGRWRDFYYTLDIEWSVAVFGRVLTDKPLDWRNELRKAFL
jgi:hypothetical protein